MRWKSLGVSMVFVLSLAACGADEGGQGTGDDEAILQITSEGGFVPVEVSLGNGPRYSLLGDGSLIFQGVQLAIYPGPLVPPYMVTRLNDGQMNAVRAMVEDIGMPEIGEETDDGAANFVADATTEVITYWDENGEHRLAVYALGMEESPSDRNAAFLELVETFDRFTAEAPSEPYEPQRARVIAGTDALVDPEFEDVREWPVEATDFSDWTELSNGWYCKAFDGEVLEAFADSTQATMWRNPDDSASGEPMMLLVRPLLPGEPDCP
jgi:hypothetical protein